MYIKSLMKLKKKLEYKKIVPVQPHLLANVEIT
jgi:hypothetical protein